jgi:methylmalonyl-CoA mutase
LVAFDFSFLPISVSMTINGAVLPMNKSVDHLHFRGNLFFFQLRTTIENDMLNEFIVRNTYMYPFEQSTRIIGDVFCYTSAQVPQFDSISIGGSHMKETGARATFELAYTIADGL